MDSTVRTLWQKINNSFDPSSRKSEEFSRDFERNLKSCRWEPHPLYSVFTQYDQDYYLRQKESFLHKYRCFYAVSKSICPKRIIELGTAAGSSADAYLSATPTASYVGFDSFGVDFNQAQQTVWDPREIATKLFASRGFKDYELIQLDLRTLERLPCKSDFVVVDAGHDFKNEYADLKLALTAEPLFIFIDDASGEDGVQVAIEQFLKEDINDRVDFIAYIDYQGGGLIIKLKP
jgi:hypothetical protein